MNNYRVYSAPTCVQAVAERLRSADNLLVTFEGTYHVYVSAHSVADVLLGLTPLEGFTTRDVQEMPK